MILILHAGACFAVAIAFRLILNYTDRSKTEEEFTRNYDQMLIDLLSNDFCGMWHYMTALRTKP